MFARAHLVVALQLVQGYTGHIPFVHHLKQYFSTHKKHGSRDRKQIAQLCYCWFRLGHAFKNLEPVDRMIAGLFLCSKEPNGLLQSLHEEWNEKTTLSTEAKLALIDPENILSLAVFAAVLFPLQSELSADIDATAFACSHLDQPDLFIRIRPAYLESVQKKLNKAGVPFIMETSDGCRLPNGFKVEELFSLNQELVVQDLNSQRATGMVEEIAISLRQQDDLAIWDACAASGGKSIFVFDRLPGARLTVSDIRSSILQNLYQRFRQAGLYSYNGFVADLSDPAKAGEEYRKLEPQQLIIADLPCTGSGTWSRTPEQLCFFEAGAIENYAALQKKILASLIPKLAEGGYLLYITCSVFSKENEANINWLLETYPLQCLKMKTLNGYSEKADSMFAALLQKL
ncbi:RsmB/NOP family class I SAM-dependent RNA methyltransferase [Flavihumibacter cheonanensis]|uniref:Fmu (Sun) domain-containing protein n=1 Tax=Flavihumibacter cheonanensis TaxID=1442385 RepID=UPI001EF97CA7|nr:Fmu (Sun) domain-containing protein [Flavihumibacter cheonanensis]MCG7750788.1 Fmu (Sun) domain-containing protein [Flavihumibacter cheonanensis]